MVGRVTSVSSRSSTCSQMNLMAALRASVLEYLDIVNVPITTKTK